MARIALDAMGGDFALGAPIGGALLALEELDAGHSIQLVGRTPDIERELEALLAGDLSGSRDHARRLSIVHAPDVIEMTDRPSTAVRTKPDSSMIVGLRLQRDGASDAFVSAGSTGAQMAASTLLLRLHPGLTRPAIGTVFPTAGEPVLVLDAGANVDCTAHELEQFARLGSVYAECMLGRSAPAVGLLSIGEEAEKGNAVVKEANQLLARSGLRFVGNVEGRDLPLGRTERGPIDVVVCDGFTGNILLKFYEAVAPAILSMVRSVVGVDEDKLRQIAKRLDYSEHGGAPLLGVRGVSIIAHGRSSARAIKNAIKAAARAVETRMSDRIGEQLAGSATEPS